MLLSFNSRALGLSPNLDALQSASLAHSAGFDSVDILVRDLVDHQVPLQLVADTLRRHDLRPGAWPLPVNWRGQDDLYRYDLAQLPRYARAAQSLGLAVTATWVFPAWPDPPPPGHPAADEALGWQVERLIPIARVLSDHGIALGLEVIGLPAARQGAVTPLLHRHTDLPRILDLFDPSLRLGILLDTFHLFAAGDSPCCLHELPTRYPIVWAHLAELPDGLRPDRLDATDRVRLLPGSRTPGPTQEALAFLAHRGFTGPVSIETLAVPAPQRDLPIDSYARLAVELVRPLWP